MLKGSSWKSTVSREMVNEIYFYINRHEVNENHFHQFINTHEVNEKSNKLFLLINTHEVNENYFY